MRMKMHLQNITKFKEICYKSKTILRSMFLGKLCRINIRIIPKLRQIVYKIRPNNRYLN